MKIRGGIRFHDGTPVRAGDVAFSFGEQRMFGASPLTPRAKYFKPDLVRVEALDDSTVEFVTREPDYAMEKRLASWIAWVVPRDYYLDKGQDGFGLAPVGTGPYKQKEFVRGDRIVLEAERRLFPRPPPTAPHASPSLAVPETATRVAGLISGEYHIACALTPDTLRCSSATRPWTPAACRSRTPTCWFTTRSAIRWPTSACAKPCISASTATP